MNTIETLALLLESRYPTAKVMIDKPLHPDTGVWWLDVVLPSKHHVNLEAYNGNTRWGLSLWKPGMPEIAYGEGPDAIFETLPLVEIVTFLDEFVWA
jgi:hypothetical protein